MILLLTPVLYIFQINAYAANLSTTTKQLKNATYSWSDASHIEAMINGQKYTFYDPTGVEDYWSSKDNKNAPVNLFSSNTCSTAKYSESNLFAVSADPTYTPSITYTYTKSGSVNGTCLSYTINSIKITQQQNANILFSYSTTNHTITPVSGDVSGFTFVQDPQYPYIFLKQNQANNQCADRIVVNPANYSAELWELKPGSGGHFPSSARISGCINSGDSSDIQATSGGIGGTTYRNSTGPDGGWDLNIRNADKISSSSSSPGTGTSGTSTVCSVNDSSCQSTNFNSNCVASGGAFSSLICAGINLIQDAENHVISIVQDMLETPVLSLNSQPCSVAALPPGTSAQQCNQDNISAKIWSVWSKFRLYGDILLVIALLAAIIAEAIGGGVIEAYTVKKMIPRIIVAAILINLSIYIVAGAEDIVNIIGHGIQSLIEAPFAGLKMVNISGGTGALLGGLSVVGILAGSGPLLSEGVFGIALLIIGSVVLASIGVLITLLIRQALLIFLLLVSPVAFSLYVLPNTEQYFKKWLDLLFKTLLVYPIVIAILSMSTIAYVAIDSFNLGNGGANGILVQMMGIVAAVAPMFLIPFAFRMSGGVMGQIANGINSLNGRLREPIRKARQANREARRERGSRGKLLRGAGETGFRAGFNRLAQNRFLAREAGLNPVKMRGNLAHARAAMDFAEAERNKKENHDYQLWALDDELNRAANESYDEKSLSDALDSIDARRADKGLSKRFQDPIVKRQVMQMVEKTRRSMSTSAFHRMTAVQSLAGGTAYNDADEAWEAIAKAGGNDDVAIQSMIGQGKGLLMQAGRVDQGGASFGTILGNTIKMRDELRKKGTILQTTRDQVDKEIYRSAIDSSPPGQAVYGKPGSAKHLAQAYSDKLDEMMRSYSGRTVMEIDGETRVATEKDIIQTMASAGGLYDAMNAAAPQNAREFADGLMGGDITLSTLPPDLRAALALKPGGNESVATPTIPILKAMDNLRANNPEFAQMRHDIGAQATQQAALSNAGVGAAVPPTPPGGGPPPPPI